MVEKINKEYIQHNVMRDFRFTSWIHNEELVLWDDIPTKEVKNLESINWAKCG
jgi:hypothetical protein